MSRNRFLLGVCAVVALLAAAHAPAQPLGVFIDLGVRSTSPTGTAAFAAPDGGAGFSSSAGLDREKRLDAVPGLRWLGEKYRFEASYRPSRFHGSLVTDAAGRSTSTTLFTDLDVDHISVGGRRDLITRPTFSLGLGADVDRLKVVGTARGVFPDLYETTDSRTFEAPVATFGFNLHDAQRRAFFDLKLGYSVFSQTELSKVRAEVGYGFAKHAGVKAGWEGLRYNDRGGSSRPEVDLKLSSFTGGFFFSF